MFRVDLASNNQGGIPWHSSEIPDGYACEIATADSGVFASHCEVNDIKDARIHALLVWIYHWFVNFIPGDDVVLHEETVYFVKNVAMTFEPQWCVRVECWAVWEQEHQIISFKLQCNNTA